MSNESLLKQLAHRAKDWHKNTGISQSAMAAALKMEDGNYSRFLRGKGGIGSEATCLLLDYIKLPPRQAIAKFGKPVFSCQILQLQEKGKRVTGFDNSGWVAKEGSTEDPSGSTDITQTEKAKTSTIADFLKVLAQLDGVTRASIVNAIIKAYPNPNGSTPPNGQRFSR